MMRKYTFVVFLLLAVLLAGSGLAQAQGNGRIAGHVNRPDGTPIPGVSVRVEPVGQEALTDGEGRYEIAVPPGTYSVVFSLADRTVTETGVEVTAEGVRTVDRSVDWDVSFAESITVSSVPAAPKPVSSCSRRSR